MDFFQKTETKKQLEKILVDISIKKLEDNIYSIYSYGSSNIKESNYSDIDIMLILTNFPETEDKVKNIQDLTNELYTSFSEKETILDLHIYGLDEIPTQKNPGYQLFKGFFQNDYLYYRKLLYGKDCLINLPQIDIKEESLNFLSRLERVIRQTIINPNINNTMARALFGLGTLDMHHEINIEDYNNYASFLRYTCSLTSKAYLECIGEHHILKKTNVFRIKEIFPEYSNLINDIIESKNIKHFNEKRSIEYSLKTLKFIDFIYNEILQND